MKLLGRLRLRRSKTDVPPAGEILPPEGVPLKLEIAGVGVRFAAQLTDVLLTLIGAVCIVVLLLMFGLATPQTTTAIGALLFFVIRVPYYVITELIWNGQTLGKRLMKIKVVSHNGGSLTTHAIVLRNLMKEAEIFLPGTLLLTLSETTPVSSLIALAWIAMAFAVPLSNRHRMRLGDYLAGTHVIHMPVPILLKDLAGDKPTHAKRAKEKFVFLSHHLDHYGAFELQTLEGLLRSAETAASPTAHKNQKATIAAIVDKIRRKIDYADKINEKDQTAFLRAFYNAQRQHLEQRQLFGDRRADKHFAGKDSEL